MKTRFIKKGTPKAQASTSTPALAFANIRPESPKKKTTKKKVSPPKTQKKATTGYVVATSPSGTSGVRYVKVPMLGSPSPTATTRARKVSAYTEPKRKQAVSPSRPSFHSGYKNEDLEQKTAAIQQEYEQLLNDMLRQRHA